MPTSRENKQQTNNLIQLPDKFHHFTAVMKQPSSELIHQNNIKYVKILFLLATLIKQEDIQKHSSPCA